jgi:O-antigen ligase/Tfp pilus assembly protein PilF
MFWPILVLIPFTALAMGAVHPWAYGLAGSLIFAAVGLWMLQVAAGRRPLAAAGPGAGYLGGLVAGLVMMVGLQLLPLPPQLLRLVSPHSYALYQDGLPGWPRDAAYRWAAAAGPAAGADLLPTLDEVRHGAQIPSQSPPPAAPADPVHGVRASAWMPISIAPAMTRAALLKLLMYCAAALLLIAYPFSAAQEKRLYKDVVRTVLATGLVISIAGLAEQLFSNGKPLWVFSPYDWSHGSVWGARSFGSFANPDHFADYLAMVWSFALAGMLFPGLLGRVRDRVAVPLLCGTVGLAVLAALLATASRGGWLAAAAASATILLLARRLPIDLQPRAVRRGNSGARLITAGVALFAFICLAALFTSQSSSAEADARLHSAFYQESAWARTQPARYSLRLIGQFPLFGVGLGAWPEIYPKYAPLPWDGVFMNAVHDEYVQFLAETGLLGMALLGGILLWALSRLARGFPALSRENLPAAIACAGALAAIASQALLDFPFRIPANALLATVCFAVLVRMGLGRRAGEDVRVSPRLSQRIAAAAALILCLVAIIGMWRLPRRPFPYDLHHPRNLDETVEQMLRYPIDAGLHLELAQLLDAPGQGQMRMAEIRAALKLNPHNPSAHDLFAAELMKAGNQAAALAQIELSMFYAPSLSAHPYTSGRFIDWLGRDAQDAVIAGLKRAAAAGYPAAPEALALFYEHFARFFEEAEFLRQFAAAVHDPKFKSGMLARAGAAFAGAGDGRRAADALQAALATDPRNTAAYRDLALDVYASAGQLKQARQLIHIGLAAGASAVPLYQALADVELSGHNLAGAEDALKMAATIEPYNFDLVRRLGEVYAADQKLDQATLWLRKATRIDPESAPAFLELAQVEERNFQFFAAGHAYAQAVALDAGNPDYRASYTEFKKRVARAASH